MNRLEFSKLIEQLRVGDTKARSMFFEIYYKRLCYLAWRYIKDKQKAEEIASEVIRKFLQVIQRGLEFPTFDHLNYYLYVSVRNSRKSLAKSSQSTWQKKVELADPLNMIEPEIDEDMLEAEIVNEMYKEIENLSEAEKKVLKLSLLGYKNQEIADRLEISVFTVRNQKHSGQEKLKIAMLKKHLLYLILMGFCPN